MATLQPLNALLKKMQQENGVIFDKNGTLNIITSLIASNMRLDEYDNIADAAKLLNTLEYLQCHGQVNNQGDSVYAFWKMTRQLQDRIAVENIIKWTEIFNLLYEQSVGKFYHPEWLKRIDISCFITRCGDEQKQKIDEQQQQLWSKLKKFHDHLDFSGVDVNIHDIDDQNIKLFLRIYHIHFSPGPDGVLWKKLVSGSMAKVFSYKFYTGDGYEMVNAFYRGEMKSDEMQNDEVLSVLSFSSSLMFPATLTSDLIVYRSDCMKKCPNEFNCQGFYSAALLFSSCEQFAVKNSPVQSSQSRSRLLRIRIPKGAKFLPTFAVVGKETELTILPGTKLSIVHGGIKTYREGIKGKLNFCDYVVTEPSPELSTTMKNRLFEAIVTDRPNIPDIRILLNDLRDFFFESTQN